MIAEELKVLIEEESLSLVRLELLLSTTDDEAGSNVTAIGRQDSIETGIDLDMDDSTSSSDEMEVWDDSLDIAKSCGILLEMLVMALFSWSIVIEDCIGLTVKFGCAPVEDADMVPLWVMEAETLNVELLNTEFEERSVPPNGRATLESNEVELDPRPSEAVAEISMKLVCGGLTLRDSEKIVRDFVKGP